jgi:hypothetical protein
MCDCVGWKEVGSRIKVGDTCPRCGKPLEGIEYKRRGSRVYVYGLHRDIMPDGRVKWYYHYLGPADRYMEVSRLHENVFPQGLAGYSYELEGGSRRKDYLQGLTKSLQHEIEAHTLPSKEALELVSAIDGLCAIAGELRQYAEAKAKEEKEGGGKQ